MNTVCLFAAYAAFVIYFSFRQMEFNFKAALNGRPFRWRIHKKTLQAIVADMLIVTGLSMCLDKSYISLPVIACVLDIFMFADLLYMRYYKNPLTISVIRHNLKVMKEAKESALSIVSWKDCLIFIDVIVWSAVVVILKLNCISVDRVILLSVGALIILIASIWLAIVYYYSNREPYRWNRKRIARDLGILFFHVSDFFHQIKDKIKRMKKLPDERIKQIENSFEKPIKNKFTDLCKDKNFILIQMESMQDYLIDMTVNGKEVTPNLNALMKENIRFTNMYHQTSVANTSDAELLSNVSVYPSADKPSCYEYQNNRFYALGERLKEAGYSVKGFHGNQASTWNRYLVYRQYGYDSFTDNSDMENDEIYHLGLGDSSFFRQIFEREGDKFKSEKSLLFLITLSQHHPFKQFADYDFPVGKYEGTLFGNYLKGANYADSAIGELIDDLKKRGIYDDTLILMYGDHSGIPEQYWKDGKLKEKKNSEVDNEWLREQKVAAFMHLPDDVKEKIGDAVSKDIEKIVGQVDILPTLTNLLGLDGSYMFGRDIFDDTKEGDVILREGTVITSDYIHYAADDFVYDSDDNKIELDEKLKKIIDEAEMKLKFSDEMLEYDLISEFYKKENNH